ncbi:MAG TPA: hypothetical protein VD838_04745, partial [Anaeromyxobacteraceae bacterium]|nr:hypothetical protein [Anaeromyxobacteraceae bacterium]
MVTATDTTDPARLVDPAAPGFDSRLAPVIELVRRGEIDALSLDCFDTLVGRAVPRPEVAFRVVGDRLAVEGLLAPHADASAFVHVRVTAEARARLRTPGRTEVTLAGIYDEIPEAVIAPRN